MLSDEFRCNLQGTDMRSTWQVRHETPPLEAPMRRSTLTLIAATLLALPLAAQDPARPEPPTRPSPTARARVAPREADQITEAQRTRLEAIRDRYTKEARSQREAMRERRTKMRD